MISRRHKYKVIAISNHRTYKKKKSLPKRPCKRCGRLFNRKHNRQVYCKGCQPVARRESKNKAQRDYVRRWKSSIQVRVIGTITFGKHRNKDFKREAEIVKNEVNRTHCPYNKRYDYDILGF